ncbi:expressed unknown protein [Seminavis robusta]|uniref:Uncharacterized protein n=1 Tax=Seminavis robusta TaxID=568900 RepID=A0A9N8EG04_9STRA|nr:expressed unknown protein [Seminavis robusta]|eukprot:Sro889_g216610.1 n/a (243) ;mRNA; f:28904-29632
MGLRSSLASKASLVSLSSSSSLSRCSSTEQYASGRFKRSSSSSLNLASATIGHYEQALKSNHCSQSLQRQATQLPQQTNLVSMIALRMIFQFIGSIFPEVSYVLELLKTMLVNYRDQYVMNMHHHGAFPHLVSSTSFSSLGEQIVQTMQFASGCQASISTGKLRGDHSGTIPSTQSEEFQPVAKLIVDNDEGVREGTGNPEQCWGHFADFDCAEERDIAFMTSSYALGTLNEEEDEHGDVDY